MASPSFVNATLGVAGTCSTPRPAWGVTVGVLMGVAGSLGINVGQNMQANGIEQLAEVQRVRPQVSRLWRVGLGVFALFAVINFAALALAPASILTPMESIQFVSNIAWNRFVNRRKISSRMLLGVLLTMVGTVLSVVFGAEGSSCPSSAQLESFWSSPGWIAYLAISLPVALAAHAAHTELERRRLKRSGGGQPSSRRHEVLGAMAYTLSASLAGGAQLVVHSKGFTTLVTVLLQGEGAPLRSWPLYVEASILLLCGALWGIRLTACLSYYDPLLILPLMVGAYILFGGIAGGA